jgi:sugar diacid utilization regulator
MEMRNKNLMLGALVLSVALVATGCAKPPQVELDAAKATMADASAEAQKYATDAWTKAQDAMNAVNTEMEAQNAKFALFRSYTKTKELIAAANQAAADAKTAAAANKETARNEATTAIQAAKDAVTAAQTAMTELDACKRKPKDFKADMEMMKASWDTQNAQIADLDAKMAAEDFLGARTAADALKGQADTLANDLKAAKEKIKC